MFDVKLPMFPVARTGKHTLPADVPHAVMLHAHAGKVFLYESWWISLPCSPFTAAAWLQTALAEAKKLPAGADTLGCVVYLDGEAGRRSLHAFIPDQDAAVLAIGSRIANAYVRAEARLRQKDTP